MKRQEPSLHLSVVEDKMKNKNYDMYNLATICLDSDWDNEKQVRSITKKEFRQRLKDNGLTPYKIRVLTKTFIELNLIEEDGDCYIINKVIDNHFVVLPMPTVKYCLDVLSPLAFKVYCWFKFIQFKHDSIGYAQNYFFSDTEILKACGLSRNANNLLTMNNVLCSLEDVGLIKYNHESQGRPGSHGIYKELYHVYDEAISQEQAIEDTKHDIEEIKKNEEPIPALYYEENGIEKSLPGVTWEAFMDSAEHFQKMFRENEKNKAFFEYYGQ